MALMQNLRAVWWWRHRFQIRTIDGLDILECDCFRAAFEVVGDDKPVIKQVQGVDEGIYDTFLVFPAVYVAVFELPDPSHDLFFGVLGLLKLRLQDGYLQVVPLLFQSLQTFFCGTGQYALLDGVQHILYSALRVGKLFFQRRNSGVLAVLQGKDAVGNAADFLVSQNSVDGQNDCRPLNEILLDGFLLAAQLSLCSGTLVVIMLISRMARPTFAYHHALTESAKQFSCQQVVNVRFCRCRRTFVFLQPRLHDKNSSLRNIRFLLYPLFR